MCPCCGYDLAVDAPIMINDFSMNGAGYPLMYRGEIVRLTPSQALLCWALMKAYPRRVTISALLERVSYGDVDDDNLIRVHVSRIRARLRELGAPQPVKTLRPNAYIWEPRGVDHGTVQEAVAA